MALDGGSWRTAAALMPVEDPMAEEEFGGEEWELQQVFKHQKTMANLKLMQEGRQVKPPDNPAAKADSKKAGKKKKKKEGEEEEE